LVVDKDSSEKVCIDYYWIKLSMLLLEFDWRIFEF